MAKKDTNLKVVKKIKDGERIIEVKEEDAERVDNNLRKMKVLGVMVSNIDVDEYVASYEMQNDLKEMPAIFEKLYKETFEILFRYGLCY